VRRPQELLIHQKFLSLFEQYQDDHS
jgi:hypothetical protein